MKYDEFTVEQLEAKKDDLLVEMAKEARSLTDLGELAEQVGEINEAILWKTSDWGKEDGKL